MAAAVLADAILTATGLAGRHLHVIFLPAPATEVVRSFDATDFAPEEIVVTGSELYLHLPDGLGRSKLAVAVNRIPEIAAGTARNWNTVLRVASL